MATAKEAKGGGGFTNKGWKRGRGRRGRALVIESVDCGWAGIDKGPHFQPQWALVSEGPPRVYFWAPLLVSLGDYR